MTFSGTILVNGVASSCYAVLSSHHCCHKGMSFLRLVYRISPKLVVAAHKYGGLRYKGATPYVEFLSLFIPIARFLKL